MSVFNIYCDESCHLERDRISVTAWGAVQCKHSDVHSASKAVRALKIKHGFAPNFEIKWTKVSPAKLDFYCEIVDFFLSDDRLSFRGLVVPDKHLLNHPQFNQSHDEWYAKMYYTMLRPLFEKQTAHNFHIYLDVKDTRGGPMTNTLHNALTAHLRYSNTYVEKIQQVRSHESELLQIADLLVGALTYANRNVSRDSAKATLISQLHQNLGDNALIKTSYLSVMKFNVLVWNAQTETESAPP